MELIEVVFLDAGGTLFEVRGGVGKIYSGIAASHGVTIEPETVDKLFLTAFMAKTSLGLPVITGDSASAMERNPVHPLT